MRATRKDAAALTRQREEGGREGRGGEGGGRGGGRTPTKKESHSAGEKLTEGAGDIEDEELHSIS